ncbi:MAG: hypothetical protein ACJAX3_001626 [Patiriisocius sp.]|jgi:hypothetical protein
MNKRYSRYKIHHKENCPFNEAEYSLFKFGDIFYAEKFAEKLFSGFIKKHKDWILSCQEIVILPSPYHSIQTASNYLCLFFKKQLNQFLFENDKNACVESKIYRTQTYTEDYGDMCFEQRIKLISNDTYYVDRNFINGKCCIFLDDIKITGSHEYIINEILNRNQIKGDFIFVYYAELCNKQLNPQIENYYNYYAVKNIEDIIQITRKTTFRFNTRIVKYILKMPENDFVDVFQSLSVIQQQELMQLAISNNYHQISEYQNNINILNKQLWQLI